MSGNGGEWDAEAGEGPELGLLRVDPERADRLKKSPSAFRTISEVADDLHIPQHVLRFWETRFPQVKPLKRGGGRRYYRPDDIALLRRISELLYIQGYTIKGVQRLLREGDGTLLDVPPPDVADADVAQAEFDPGPEAVAVAEALDVDPADIAPFHPAEVTWRPDAEAFPVAETGGAATVATPDGGFERLRILLRDVLDELRMLRRQIPD